VGWGDAAGPPAAPSHPCGRPLLRPLGPRHCSAAQPSRPPATPPSAGPHVVSAPPPAAPGRSACPSYDQPPAQPVGPEPAAVRSPGALGGGASVAVIVMAVGPGAGIRWRDQQVHELSGPAPHRPSSKAPPGSNLKFLPSPPVVEPGHRRHHRNGSAAVTGTGMIITALGHGADQTTTSSTLHDAQSPGRRFGQSYTAPCWARTHDDIALLSCRAVRLQDGDDRRFQRHQGGPTRWWP